LVREPSGRRERKKSESCASRRALNSTARAHALFTQLRHPGRVRRWKRAHDDVDLRQGREHIEPYDFTQPSFHAIAIDGGV
jgi:hypothetical protein